MIANFMMNIKALNLVAREYWILSSTWKMASVSRPRVGLKQRLVSNLKCWICWRIIHFLYGCLRQLFYTFKLYIFLVVFFSSGIFVYTFYTAALVNLSIPRTFKFKLNCIWTSTLQWLSLVASESTNPLWPSAIRYHLIIGSSILSPSLSSPSS